jgi:hypothetical protein
VAGYDRPIISGEPGETWTNDTAKVRYQFVASLHNTCGVCLQYHLKIGGWWPIPIHFGCRCHQVPILPGQTAPEPFTDYRKLLESMPHDQQVAAIGASNYKLLQAKVVKWEDIVTPSRVRDFREVVARGRLSVDRLVRAGVRLQQAQRAHETVHAPGHEHAERQRRELAERLARAGMAHKPLIDELSRRLAARVGIARQEAAGVVAQKMPNTGASTAAEIKRLLTTAVVTRVAMAPKPKKELAPRRAVQVKTPEKTFEGVIAEIQKKASSDLLDPKVTRDYKEIAEEKRNAIVKAIQDFAKPGPTGSYHGMKSPEAFKTIEFLGIRWHFTGDGGRSSAIYRTVEDILGRTYLQPSSRLAKSTKDVYFTSQVNKDDGYWKQRYKDFPGAHATGGQGEIVVYRNGYLDLGAFAHESGHNLAWELYSSAIPSKNYGRAIGTTEPPVSEYAKNSPAEDFAEAVKLYTVNPDKMKKQFPVRFGVIDKIMTDENYGG